MQETRVRFGASRSWWSNSLVTLLSAGLIVWAWQILSAKATSVLSVEAIVNADMTEINAPELGTVKTTALKTGDLVKAGQTLFELNNDRASSSGLTTLKAQLSAVQAELNSAQSRLDRHVLLLQTVVQDHRNQVTLERQEADRTIEELTSEQSAAQSQLQLAQLNRDRMAKLVAEGAMPQVTLDRARAEYLQRHSEVARMRARIARARVHQTAARSGLSLTQTRSNYDPRIRLEELQNQIADDRAQVQQLRQKATATIAQQQQAQTDLTLKQQAVITAPLTGVVWKLSANVGKLAQAGESLATIANCSTRWVDAYVDESSVRSLAIGDTAQVELYAQQASIVLSGKIDLIRSGVGRLAPEQAVSAPINPNLPRHTQVRIRLDNNSSTSSIAIAKNFCYIGYTGRVKLPLQATTNPIQSWLQSTLPLWRL